MNHQIIPINSIEIPDEFVDLASEWYDGMNDTLYAITSTGGLTLGTIRPPGATDEQWYVTLFESLSCDVGYARRAAVKSGHEDSEALERFEDWADEQVAKLRESYGLEDWEV